MKKTIHYCFTLCAFLFPFYLVAQTIEQKNILVDKFDNSAKASESVVRLWEELLRGEFISLHQSISVVDRAAYDLVKQERAKEKSSSAGTNKQGVTLGAEYLLTGDVISVNISNERVVVKTETYTPEATKADPKPKPVERKIYGIKCSANVTVKIKFVDIATGEIKFDKTTSTAQSTTIDDTDFISKIQKGKIQVLKWAFKAIPNEIRPEIVFILNPKYYILEVTKGAAPKIKKVLLTGGKKAGFPNYGEIYLNVYEAIEENVDGQKLIREVLLGNIKAEDIYEEVTEATVIKGNEAIGAKIQSGAKIYCRFEKIPTAGNFY